MANTAEYDIESIVILILTPQSGLSGVSLKHYDEDTDTVADRITVKVEPRETELPSYKPADNSKVWKARIVIQIHVATRDAALIETYGKAIDDAMTGAAPAAAVTAAGTAFPNGIEIHNDDTGNRQESGAETRTREKIYTAIFR